MGCDMATYWFEVNSETKQPLNAPVALALVTM
jgi:hypothetical protein